MNGDAGAPHGYGVPSMFSNGFGSLPIGARVIATRTTTTHQVATGGGASAALHFDQLKTLALNMGMAASAGAAQKSKAEEKAAESAAKIAELQKALSDARREVRHAWLCAPRASRAGAPAVPELLARTHAAPGCSCCTSLCRWQS